MKIDVYYPELGFTRSEQKPVFELLSLMSEIGGFLGLLLGVSVLTVCEMIDFIAMWFISKLK